jgi:fused signal recognition particle receptor
MAKGLFSWFSRGSKDKTDAPAPEQQPLSEETHAASTEAPVVASAQEETVVAPVAEEGVSGDSLTELAEPAIVAAEIAVVTETEYQSDVAVQDASTDAAEDIPAADSETLTPIETFTQDKPKGLFGRLVQGLRRTRETIGAGFIALFKGKKLDDDLFDELETQLLLADLGVETTQRIMQNLIKEAKLSQLKDAEALYGLLKKEMSDIITPVSQPLQIDTSKTPYVILMVGVNGVGKTTTIGKLAKRFQAEGKSVMLAAGDTFRAAAVEQLQVWGQRNNIPVVAQHTGADSASVIFDAIQAAKSRHIDILIADTAGRLQNKNNLMEELKKIVRVMKKHDESAPHEVMLTLDAGTGQNAISQAKLFGEAVGVSGLTITKLDGTAKGGVVFAIADQFGIPIRYIGVGEAIEDLRTFDANDFIEALFSGDQH